jgi:hypothetical protein
LANFERGVYEPSDEVRVFDGSEEEDDIEGSRLPLLIVLALLVLAMFGGVVWLAYTQGVARGRGETPVLTAAGGPERVAPQQAGGNNVPYQGFKIYEQPAPPDDSADAAPPSSAAPKPAPNSAPNPASAQAATPPKPVAASPAKPAPAPAAAPPKSVAALIQQANSVPEPAKPVPAPKPAKPAAAAPVPAGATGAPRQLAAAQAPVSAPAASGGFVLQIGAYKSQADADTAWKTYKGRHAALLSGYSNNVQQVDLGEKGTWYRLRIGGLSDREVATALCDRLKADGGACMLSK